MALDALSDVSDEALLVLYGNGDRSAARALTLRLTPRIFGFAARMLGDRAEAEDVVQEAMLPRIPTDWEGVEIAARSEPADATGGDFYDLLQFPDGRVGFVIGDASGHGFAAALVSANTRSYLRAMLRTEPDAGRVLSAMNALLMEDGIDGRFVTLLFAVVDPPALKLSYASAGHCGYLLDSSGALRVCLDQGGAPLGWHEGAGYPPYGSLGLVDLALHQHGKSKVRLGRVWREGDVHHMVEWNVYTMLESAM
jgi:hypothetical protein